MPVSARRFKGKLRREIADEAFAKLGKDASVRDVDAYFLKHYGLDHCERSMWAAARRKAMGLPEPVRRSYRRESGEKEPRDLVNIVIRLKQLAYDIGGWDELEELVRALKP